MFSDGDDVRACDFCDGDSAIGFIAGVKIDVVGTDARCDGEFEVLGFGKAVCCKVAGMETVD